MQVSISSRKTIVGLVAATLASTCFGFASWGSHKTSERGAEVIFSSTTKFQNGDVLPAGTYWMEVPENSQAPVVKFYKEHSDANAREFDLYQEPDHSAMASVKAHVVSEQKKNAGTQVDTVASRNKELVRTILPAGWHERLVFAQTGQHSSATATP